MHVHLPWNPCTVVCADCIIWKRDSCVWVCALTAAAGSTCNPKDPAIELAALFTLYYTLLIQWPPPQESMHIYTYQSDSKLLLKPATLYTAVAGN